MKKYTWKEIKEQSWKNDIFDTIEECIEDAKRQDDIYTIHVVNVKPYKPYIWADDILEKIENEVYEDYDIDFEFAQDENVDELSKRLTDVLHQWLNETHQNINCYDVDIDTIKKITF